MRAREALATETRGAAALAALLADPLVDMYEYCEDCRYFDHREGECRKGHEPEFDEELDGLTCDYWRRQPEDED